MTANLDYPSIIVIGLHGKDGLSIIQGILSDSLPQQHNTDCSEKYKWLIDNKYYKAEVELCNVKNSKNIFSFNSTEAAIIYIDSSKVTTLNDVNDVLNGLENQHINVKLLVCDGFINENDILSKGKAQEWCIEHGWELVELNIECDDSDDSDDFNDSWGFTRIRQALNAHTWSNLELKDKKDSGIEHILQKISLNDDKRELPFASLESNHNESECNTNCEDKDDDFSALFFSLGEMKEKAESLPPIERRIYAEKMAMAFLKCFEDEEDCEDLESQEEQLLK